MLNTFENAGRHHLRTKERQRYLESMDAFANGLVFADESTIVSIIDELSGPPRRLQLPEEATSNVGHKPRRWGRLKAIIVAAAMIVATIMAYLAGRSAGEEEGAAEGAQVGTTTSNSSDIRDQSLSSMILDWGLTTREVLEDASSASARAYSWLVYEDRQSVDFQTIKTRFALATLYFSTQNTSSSQELWTKETHWLSSYPVCLWYGVECIEQQDTIELVKALNLSSNGLQGKHGEEVLDTSIQVCIYVFAHFPIVTTNFLHVLIPGTLPDELGLLGLDCQLLDVSYNSITGPIPQSLLHMRNLVNLYLGPNLFTSIIPSGLNQLSNLVNLYINDCLLSGSIPQEVGNLNKLRTSAFLLLPEPLVNVNG
jgi:hypothetical protein